MTTFLHKNEKQSSTPSSEKMTRAMLHLYNIEQLFVRERIIKC